ncbi:Uncharacterised protein [Chryseobacterium gleum]|uniref:Uncharacterized protein n=2 Tax=Chryseobacterium gleum TaxID=250 RepID=A0A3S4MSN9_CHRGE|nr:hypothetical protein HMPREF0204_11393 [Chryseobacterium gleum ATCC 35910]VEE10690.1 Uncharacterised protein [Chryseobacterium gleum]
MLHDVLDWLFILYPESEYYVNTAGEFCENNHTRDYQEHLTIWNFSKPYLKDQSPELIKFLHSLIKTKQ